MSYETVHPTTDFSREPPYELSRLQAWLAANMVLRTFCIQWNDQLGRPSLAFADLVDW
jgi:hypothetical protein